MSRGSIRAVRVLCHAQHFKGIGHFVRMHAIARGMSEAHEVYLVDGGRPVPRRPGPIELIPLPRLVRVEGRVVGLETATPVASLVEQRIRLLTQAVERIVAAGRAHGKALGFMAADANLARQYRKLGFNMIASGTDQGLLMAGVRTILELLRTFKKP